MKRRKKPAMKRREKNSHEKEKKTVIKGTTTCG